MSLAERFLPCAARSLVAHPSRPWVAFLVELEERHPEPEATFLQVSRPSPYLAPRTRVDVLDWETGEELGRWLLRAEAFSLRWTAEGLLFVLRDGHTVLLHSVALPEGHALASTEREHVRLGCSHPARVVDALALYAEHPAPSELHLRCELLRVPELETVGVTALPPVDLGALSPAHTAPSHERVSALALHPDGHSVGWLESARSDAAGEGPLRWFLRSMSLLREEVPLDRELVPPAPEQLFGTGADLCWAGPEVLLARYVWIAFGPPPRWVYALSSAAPSTGHLAERLLDASASLLPQSQWEDPEPRPLAPFEGRLGLSLREPNRMVALSARTLQLDSEPFALPSGAHNVFDLEGHALWLEPLGAGSHAVRRRRYLGGEEETLGALRLDGDYLSGALRSCGAALLACSSGEGTEDGNALRGCYVLPW